MPLAYNDRYFRIVLGVIAAHIIVMYNEQDTFFEAVFTLSYLKGLAGSFIIAMVLIEYVHYVTLRLDKRFDWLGSTLMRLIWQSLLAFAIPAVLAFLLAALFFFINGVNIFSTTYLEQDYTVVLFMLLTINIYYFGLNAFLRLRHASGALPHGVSEMANIGRDYPPFNTIGKVQDNDQSNTSSPSKEIIVIETPTKSIPVRTENITYCYILSGNVFVRTDDMASINESYQITGTLKVLEELLDKRLFFRINRQLIVNFNACRSFKPGRNKTLELALEPEPYAKGAKIPQEHQRLCIVSEDRVQDFKVWMYR